MSPIFSDFLLQANEGQGFLLIVGGRSLPPSLADEWKNDLPQSAWKLLTRISLRQYSLNLPDQAS
ncbi:hypothetical protein JOY44_26190 (plasmid) [Phormidium sp. CLA17]|uniref:hypothetical protein n=1 Tax=Leptolyngbya sp. Cla-17 TaxID=2803751 RepID=UPI0019341CC3|nr:hypothetical protein [Leptolyngbya sp. Cla-17]MBM0745013.1 hypothetical protein [Leptolyngbya sp. Cla-17]